MGLLGGTFGGVQHPSALGHSAGRGLLIAARLPEPYLIPSLITRHACAADKQDPEFRCGLLWGERCSGSRRWGAGRWRGCSRGAESPPSGIGTRVQGPAGVLPRVGEGRPFHGVRGGRTVAGNGASGSTPSLLLFKQKKVPPPPGFGQEGDI